LPPSVPSQCQLAGFSYSTRGRSGEVAGSPRSTLDRRLVGRWALGYGKRREEGCGRRSPRRGVQMVDRQNQPSVRRRALESRRVARDCAARVTRACHRWARDPRESLAMSWWCEVA
jgi:hypothetical protein